jgi:hypothetical protein
MAKVNSKPWVQSTPPKDFTDWLIPQVVASNKNYHAREDIVNQLLYTPDGIKFSQRNWDSEVKNQSFLGNCPPSCTPFELYLIDTVNPKYTRKASSK